MPMQKLLDLSSGNIPSSDAKLLQTFRDGRRDFRVPLIVYRYEYGWTVSTAGLLNTAAERADRLTAMSKAGFSEHFIKVMSLAADQDAVLVRFDADAAFEPGLPRFDWENDDEMTLDTSPPAP
jgi:hypothetical protein